MAIFNCTEVVQNSDSRLGSGRKYGNGRLGGGYGERAGWAAAGTAMAGV